MGNNMATELISINREKQKKEFGLMEREKNGLMKNNRTQKKKMKLIIDNYLTIKFCFLLT